MKKFRNEITIRKWVELILAIYNGDYYYNKLRSEERKISEKEAINQIERQIQLMKMRIPKKQNISINDILSMNFEVKSR